MHWLWEAVIAVAVGTISIGLTYSFVEGSTTFLIFPDGSSFQLPAATLPLLWGLVISIVVVATYELLNQSSHKSRESETRCRTCDYILRGITEPRCPECGERI